MQTCLCLLKQQVEAKSQQLLANPTTDVGMENFEKGEVKGKKAFASFLIEAKNYIAEKRKEL